MASPSGPSRPQNRAIQPGIAELAFSLIPWRDATMACAELTRALYRFVVRFLATFFAAPALLAVPARLVAVATCFLAAFLATPALLATVATCLLAAFSVAFLAAPTLLVAVAICFLATFSVAFLATPARLVAAATCFFPTFFALAISFAMALRLVRACFSTRSTTLELPMAAAVSLIPCCTFEPAAAVASSKWSIAASTLLATRVSLRAIAVV